MVYYLLTSIYVLVCLFLVMVILLQQGKGGDMASAFGGGSSQTAFGARAGATVLSKLTTGAAVLFMVFSLVLAIIGERGPGSLMQGTAPPLPPPSSSPQSPNTVPPTGPGGQPGGAPQQGPESKQPTETPGTTTPQQPPATQPPATPAKPPQ
jgi:preprotein translocase subunit SecG